MHLHHSEPDPALERTRLLLANVAEKSAERASNAVDGDPAATAKEWLAITRAALLARAFTDPEVFPHEADIDLEDLDELEENAE
jgi:hypothetical protein